MILRDLLIMRLLVLNAIGLAGTAWAYQQGHIAYAFTADTTYISHSIVVLFLVGLASVFQRAIRVSRGLNSIKGAGTSSARLAVRRDISDGGVKFLEKGAHIDSIVGWLVSLGLLGTVIGFAMALASIDTDALTTVEGVQAMITNLMAGMRVAIITTIVGAICALWLEINARTLRTSTIAMIEDARL